MIKFLGQILSIAALGLMAVPGPCAAGDADADQTVLAFYKRYIGNFMSEKKVRLSSYRQLDRDCLAKIKAMTARAAKNNPDMGGLEYDPLLWGQEAPDAVVVEKSVADQDSALVTLKKKWEGESEGVQRICVSLKARKAGWKIVDTVDPSLLKKKVLLRSSGKRSLTK